MVVCLNREMMVKPYLQRNSPSEYDRDILTGIAHYTELFLMPVTME